MSSFDNKPNGVELLRRFKTGQKTISTLELACLKQGFASEFWKIIRKQLDESLAACRQELEVNTSHDRQLQLQGEIAALKVVIDIYQATTIPTVKPPLTNL